MKPNSKWLDNTLMVAPASITLCLTEDQYARQMRRLKMPKAKWPEFMPSKFANATTHSFESDNGSLCFIITVGDLPNVPTESIYALLVHEAVHVWQSVREAIGESNPSVEFEAYSIQKLSLTLMNEYKRLTKWTT